MEKKREKNNSINIQPIREVYELEFKQSNNVYMINKHTNKQTS